MIRFDGDAGTVELYAPYECHDSTRHNIATTWIDGMNRNIASAYVSKNLHYIDYQDPALVVTHQATDLKHVKSKHFSV